ncbi:hemicentin-1-like [Scylla paramamosain]|uniref:hemicentin-1-like n=1 Tax=Scylla paramamosain TaxID=85552 RepID=UPI003082FBE2
MREGGAAWERSTGPQCRSGASTVPIMVFLRPLVFVTFYAIAMTTVRSQEEEAVWSVTGVPGRSSDLPCYLNPRTPGDRPKLILWYKRGIRTPVFTYDGREPQLQSGTHEAVGALTLSGGAATLTLTSVGEDSGGLYECRVDFFKSPTHTSLVNLTIIEPPRSVEVLDSQMGRAEDGIVGPYHEGQKVVLTCISWRGTPLPNVTWWREERLLDETWEVGDEGRQQVNNSLVVERLTREWHNATLTCAATNTPLAEPITASVTIKMFLLPTSVVIRGPGAVREGSQAELLCTSSGSRPPAKLTWAFEGRTLESVQLDPGYVGGGSEVSTARLLVNVTREHNGTRVACVATNPTRPESPLTNTTTLTVHYPPRVTATMGQNVDPSRLKVKDDVYFDCIVSANPHASPITWYHEGRVLIQNLTGGVILAGNSLALQSVKRQQAGRYTCSATNPLGTATSDPVTLRIKYSPVCLSSPTAYFIYDKPINITCTVSSYPAVSVIMWQWNNSNEVIETPSLEVSHDEASAQMTVHPLQSQEDRALSCWAVKRDGEADPNLWLLRQGRQDAAAAVVVSSCQHHRLVPQPHLPAPRRGRRWHHSLQGRGVFREQNALR